MPNRLPWRGEAGSPDRPTELALPPRRAPRLRGTRPLKRWRYVAVFSDDVMLCAARAEIAGLTRSWWAVWERGARRLHERTLGPLGAGAVRLDPGLVAVQDGDVTIALVLEEGPGVETVCPHGGGWVWTRKQAAIAARGALLIAGRRIDLEGRAVVDDTVGYHARRTAWRWSAGAGRLADGRTAGWNLVEGVNDPPHRSERSIWLDGLASEPEPVRFAADLSALSFAEGGELRFAAEAVRERHERLGPLRSDYVQPFGTFSGTLAGALELVEGLGVMERHEARW